jgi:hypothetical protein
MIKALKNLGIEGSYLSIIKDIYGRPIVNIILNGKRTEIISSKFRNETRMSIFSALIQHSS